MFHHAGVEAVRTQHDAVAIVENGPGEIRLHYRILAECPRQNGPQLTVHGFLLRDEPELELHFDVGVIRRQSFDLSIAHEINPGIADVTDCGFLVSKHADRKRRGHAPLFGLHTEVVDIEIGLVEDLREDRSGLAAFRCGFECVQRDIDSHSAGDIATAQAADAVCDSRDGAVQQTIVLIVGLPEADAVLILMTDRSYRR